MRRNDLRAASQWVGPGWTGGPAAGLSFALQMVRSSPAPRIDKRGLVSIPRLADASCWEARRIESAPHRRHMDEIELKLITFSKVMEKALELQEKADKANERLNAWAGRLFGVGLVCLLGPFVVMFWKATSLPLVLCSSLTCATGTVLLTASALIATTSNSARLVLEVIDRLMPGPPMASKP